MLMPGFGLERHIPVPSGTTEALASAAHDVMMNMNIEKDSTGLFLEGMGFHRDNACGFLARIIKVGASMEK